MNKPFRIIAAAFIVSLLSALPASAQIKAAYITEPIRLDGRLDDAAWDQAQVIDQFVQKELTEGEPATERTEVRILFDDENLYVGIMCYDSEPDKIVHKELTRDGNISSEDRVDFVIDTYNDRRMAYFFATNPNGVLSDGTLQAIGRQNVNISWDGIWDVQSRIGDYGWSCEFMIPFKTLQFPATAVQTWGINFKRAVMRKNEECLWRCWRRNEGIFELSQIGTVVIEKPLDSSRQLDVTPYMLAGAEQENGGNWDDTVKYGLDARVGINTNTTLDLTTRTDFAQIESDAEVINLTRFNVSYPEQRDFFLEGSEVFDFSQGRNKLFYSRKIGLTEDRELVPILGGAKLTQKNGTYRLGVLSMQTEADKGQPSTNYSVVRVKKDILEQSYIGAIVTSLYEEGGHDNQVVAADIGYKTGSFMGENNLQIQSYLAGSVTDGETDDNLAGRVYMSMPNDTYSVMTLYHARQELFNPELGFIDRPGVQQFMGFFSLTPRVDLAWLPFIKKLRFTPLWLNQYADMGGTKMSQMLLFQPFGFETTAEDSLNIRVQRQYEYHDETFDLFEDVTIPVGEYEWWQSDIRFSTSKKRVIALATEYQFGDYYNGSRNRYDVECLFKHTRFYSVSATMRYNEIDIFDHAFDTREYGGRLTVDFSNRLFTSTFVQWNNETREANVNVRIHWIPRIGSDVYIAYNHLMDEANDYNSLQQAGMFKVDYTMRF